MMKRNGIVFMFQLLLAVLCKEVWTRKCLDKLCNCNAKLISCKEKNLKTVLNFNAVSTNQRIETIDLSSNHLEALPPNFISNQGSLSKLLLRNNSIECTDKASFNVSLPESNGISPLKYIDLRDNHLHFFPECFDRTNSSASFQNLETLLIGGNLFGSRLEMNSFSGISEVKKLDVSRNLIRAVPDLFFKKLENLEDLDLSSNNLQEMSSMVFSQHVPLRVIRLNHNLLPSVPQNLPRTVKELQLSSNEISGLSITDAKYINILKNLQILDLSRNHIQFLPYGTFSDLTRLEYLDLSFNLLKVLDVDAMTGAVNLKYFFLHNNPTLTAITHFAFSTLPRLRYFAIHQCSLSSLNLDGANTSSTSLQKIWIFGNPLTCNCYIVSLVRFLRKQKVNLDPVNSSALYSFIGKNIRGILQRKLNQEMATVGLTQCAGPLNRYKVVAGKTLLSIPEEHFTCPDEMKYVIVASFLGIFAFLSVIPVVVFLIQMYLLTLRFVQKHFGFKKEKED